MDRLKLTPSIFYSQMNHSLTSYSAKNSDHLNLFLRLPAIFKMLTHQKLECINLIQEKTNTHIDLQLIVSFGQTTINFVSGKVISNHLRLQQEHDLSKMAGMHPIERAFIKIEDNFDQMNFRFNNVFVKKSQYGDYRTIVAVNKDGKKFEFEDKEDVFDKTLIQGTRVLCVLNGNNNKKGRHQINLVNQQHYIVPLITYDDDDTAHLEVFSCESSKSLYKIAVQEDCHEQIKNLLCLTISSPLRKNGNFLCQNYQFSSVHNNRQLIKFVEFEIQWKKDQVKVNLIGAKLFLMTQSLRNYENLIFPAIDANGNIIGTQIVGKTENIKFLNFNIDEYQCKSDIVLAGYKQYIKTEYSQFENLLVESHLTDKLIQNQSFQTNEKLQILEKAMFNVLNMVQFDFLFHLKNSIDFRYHDFLQPLELLDGQSYCEYIVSQPQEIEQMIKYMNPENQVRESLIQDFLKIQKKCTLQDYMKSQGLIRNPYEMRCDFYSTTALSRCLCYSEQHIASAEFLLDMLIEGQKHNKHQQDYIIEVLPTILKSKRPFKELISFLQYFNEENDEDGEQELKIAKQIQSSKVPKYSDDPNEINYFKMDLETTPLFSQFNVSYNFESLIEKQIIAKSKNVSSQGYFMQYFSVDLKTLILQDKLSKFRRTNDEAVKTISNHLTNYEIANYLQQITIKYPGELENMQTIQSVIDFQYQTTTWFFTCQAWMFLLFFMLPFLAQIFLNQELGWTGVIVCNTICVPTMIIFLTFEMIQLKDQGLRDYFSSFYNWIDISFPFVFFCYFAVRVLNLRWGYYNLKNKYSDTDKDQYVDTTLVPFDLFYNLFLKNYGIKNELDFHLINLSQEGFQGCKGSSSQWKCVEDSIYGRHQEYDDNTNVAYYQGFLSLYDRLPLLYLNMFLLTCCLFKIVFYLRINKQYGQLVELVSQCLVAVVPFTIFFFGSIMYFSCIDMMVSTDMEAHNFFADTSQMLKPSALKFLWNLKLGDSPPQELLDMASKDELMNWVIKDKFWIFVSQFYITLIKSLGFIIKPPNTQMWDDYNSNVSQSHSKTWMPKILWIFWMINCYFNTIMMLNFMIAIISQSYDSVMNQSVRTIYTQRADMNFECMLFLKTFGLCKPFETFIISSTTSQGEVEQEWQGFVRTIKNFIQNKFKDLSDKQTLNWEKRQNHEIRQHQNIIHELGHLKTQIRKVEIQGDQMSGQMNDIQSMLQGILRPTVGHKRQDSVPSIITGNFENNE